MEIRGGGSGWRLWPGSQWWRSGRPGRSFDWRAFRSVFSHVDWPWLALASAFAYSTYLGRAWRWAVFLRPFRPAPSIWRIFKATLIGFTAVMLLGRPGEIVRPYLIARNEGVSLASQLAVWLLERLFDLLFALVIFGFGLSRIDVSRSHLGNALRWMIEKGGGAVWILSSICLILLIFLSLNPALFRARLLGGLGFLHARRLEVAEKFVDTFLQGAESLRSVRAVLEVTAYSVLEWFLIACCYVCGMRSFGAISHFGIIDVLMYMGFVSFGAVVQLPGIGGGMQVVSVLVLHEIFGMPIGNSQQR